MKIRLHVVIHVPKTNTVLGDVLVTVEDCRYFADSFLLIPDYAKKIRE